MPKETSESVPRIGSVRSQPLIAVRNVRASRRWYRQLLRVDTLPEHEHRDSYDQMLCNGRLILQLHAWDEEDHPNLVNADAARARHEPIPVDSAFSRFIPPKKSN